MTIIVHKFVLGDVDDPEIYAAQPLWEWQQTDVGRWVMENSIESPSYTIMPNYDTYAMQCVVRAKFTESDATFFKLKYDYINRN